MHQFFLYLIFLTALVLTYLAVTKGMELYFTRNKGRWKTDSNYLSSIALAVLVAGFLAVLNPPIVMLLYNYIIVPIVGWFGGRLETIDITGDTPALVAYIVLTIGVLGVLLLSYRNRITQALTEEKRIAADKAAEQSVHDLTIQERPKIGANLHQRVQNWLQLKYPNDTIQCKTIKPQCYVIYRIEEDRWDYKLRLYYVQDDVFNTAITKKAQESIVIWMINFFELMKTDAETNGKRFSYYLNYIVLRGTFEFHPDLTYFKTFNEQTFINHLVGFQHCTTYLNKLVEDVETKPLRFSAAGKTLNEVYIEPNISGASVPPDATVERIINNWLTDTTRRREQLVLLGDYGLGKSTLLKYYVAQVAKRILEGKSFERFPVFISLTNQNLFGGDIYQVIKAFSGDTLGIPYKLFQQAIHEEKVVFILDGFDEMSFIGTKTTRYSQLNTIWQLATEGNKIILSGRPSYLEDYKRILRIKHPKQHQATIADTFYTTDIQLSLLEEKAILTYLQKHFTPNKAQQYYEWIQVHDSILDLCKRPVLLGLVGEMLPNLVQQETDKAYNAAALMQDFVGFWIERQESKISEETGKPILSAFKGTSEEKKHFVKSFFTTLFVYFFEQDIQSISRRALEVRLEKALKDNDVVKVDTDEEMQTFYKDGLINELCSSFFVEQRQEGFTFVHKSFYEFFVGKHIANLILENDKDNRFSWRLIRKKYYLSGVPHDIFNKKWTEEIALAAYQNVLLWKKEVLETNIYKAKHSDIFLKPELLTKASKNKIINIVELISLPDFSFSALLFVSGITFLLCGSMLEWISKSNVDLIFKIVATFLPIFLFFTILGIFLVRLIYIKKDRYYKDIENYIKPHLMLNTDICFNNIYNIVLRFFKKEHVELRYINTHNELLNEKFFEDFSHSINLNAKELKYYLFPVYIYMRIFERQKVSWDEYNKVLNIEVSIVQIENIQFEDVKFPNCDRTLKFINCNFKNVSFTNLTCNHINLINCRFDTLTKDSLNIFGQSNTKNKVIIEQHFY